MWTCQCCGIRGWIQIISHASGLAPNRSQTRIELMRILIIFYGSGLATNWSGSKSFPTDLDSHQIDPYPYSLPRIWTIASNRSRSKSFATDLKFKLASNWSGSKSFPTNLNLHQTDPDPNNFLRIWTRMRLFRIQNHFPTDPNSHQILIRSSALHSTLQY